ncbi:MAG: T9SS type A sorting domain-containing protein [Flavobacteriales bacterium]|nr:T9SS type A sorting domain-containing protein [Flavobacteriales bacterium]
MKHILPLFLAVFAVSTVTANDVHGTKDPNEVRLVTVQKRTFNEAYQYQLRNQPNWRNFLLDNGTWYVHFNETNAKPHNAFGKPITVPGTDFTAKAQYFIEHHLQGFGIPVDELELATETENAHLHQVFFTQRHNGKDVLLSRLSVKFSLDGRVVGFCADVFDHIGLDEAVLSPTEATNAAMAELAGSVQNVQAASDVKILPVPNYERKMATFRPVYVVTVYTMDENRIPANYLTYVDAVDGKIWMRKDLVDHCVAEPPAVASVTVTDDVSLTQPYDPEVNSVLANMEVKQGGNTFYTDANGEVVGLNEGTVNLALRGLWSEVFTNGVTPTATTVLGTGSNAFDWGTVANSKESSAYYHVNIIHDYMKSKFPTFTDMDSPLATNIDVAGSCNAFYDGTSINFYQSGAGCNSFALVGDVVYHEYGHGINNTYYASLSGWFQNGAMDEGYADVWALGVTDNPVLGIGNSQSLPNDYIRRYDIDPKVYPQDIVGEVHSDGEIIAGAWWDLGQNFGDLQQMMDLYSATFDGLVTGPDGDEGQVYVDVLVEALLIDDSPANGGDNDITNGTPNDLDIINAFDIHGITLLSNATLAHTPILEHDDQGIDITMTVQADYPWALTDAIVAYRVNDGTTWSTVSLSNTTGNNYAGTIPAQPIGTVVAYYVALQNLNGTLANVQPFAADLDDPNVPYYIMVGFTQNRIEDFDNFQDAGWVEGLPTDNNSTGTWTIDAPVGSFSDAGVMVQTDQDHTPGAGNIACAITGNSTSASAGIGDNDVDDGSTTLLSPIFDVSEFTNPAISYWRYYTNSPPTGANPGADWWQVLVTDNGTDWVFVENSKVSDPSFRRVAFRVADYVQLTDQVRVKFIASDSTHLGQNLDGGSLVEGAMDDLQLWEEEGGAMSGINESEITTLSVYPNPTSGVVSLNMQLESASSVSVELFNVVGAMVAKRTLGELPAGKFTKQLDLSEVHSGIYQLRISSKKGQVVKRLEIMR